VKQRQLGTLHNLLIKMTFSNVTKILKIFKTKPTFQNQRRNRRTNVHFLCTAVLPASFLNGLAPKENSNCTVLQPIHFNDLRCGCTFDDSLPALQSRVVFFAGPRPFPQIFHYCCCSACLFLCTFLPSFSHPTHFSAAVSSNSLCCSSSSFRSHTAADATADADSTNCRKHGQ
jgi:hypothetical protein